MSAVDINGNGIIDLAGPDRVSSSDMSYQSDASNNWWQLSASILYARDNSTTPTTNSIQRTRLTGFGVYSGSCLLTSESCSQDLLGNPTISRTFIDRPTKTITQSTT